VVYWGGAGVGEPRGLGEQELAAAAAAFERQRSMLDMSG
jgi:hypothetical protein